MDVDDCLLASEANNTARNAVRAWARAEGIPAHDRDTGVGVLRNLIVREGTPHRADTDPARDLGGRLPQAAG